MWVWISSEPRRCAICSRYLAWYNQYPTCGRCFVDATQARWEAKEAAKEEATENQKKGQDKNKRKKKWIEKEAKTEPLA